MEGRGREGRGKGGEGHQALSPDSLQCYRDM